MSFLGVGAGASGGGVVGAGVSGGGVAGWGCSWGVIPFVDAASGDEGVGEVAGGGVGGRGCNGKIYDLY